MRVFPKCNARISAARYYSSYLFSTSASICKEISLQKEILVLAEQLGNLLRMRQISIET
jgi:hypothetical protein